ncbi:MAG: TIR domain-containing protein, partial [Actinobacteria bacterium]|nr:TIR domain-containing protein [Actinomycetota bacterium]
MSQEEPDVPERWDVFVSYASEDGDWVQVLAENLHRSGLEVFLDRWEVVGGDRLSQRLQDGLSRASVVVLVVSPAAVGKPWWQEEFAAAMVQVVGGGQRLVPVLLGEVVLPPFVASRLYFDFRSLDSPAQYRSRFEQLVAAVRGEPGDRRPPREGGVVVPPGVYRPEGPQLARLTIGRGEVVFSTGEREVAHAPLGVDHHVRTLVWELERTRARVGKADPVLLKSARVGSGSAQAVLHARLIEVGRVLGSRFVDGPVGVAIAGELAGAQAGNAALRLAVQVEDPELADLPWETLVVPGQDQPLVLQDRVELHRVVVSAGTPTAVQLRGPLRILAVIASPESGGGELLDYEVELARILDAVDPTRRRDDAYVQVLNWGSAAAIREALTRERFHVLHLSCHAQPGTLLLETDTGHADPVDAARFVREVLIPDHGVPLVVLAGCSTALTTRGRTQEGPEPDEDQTGERVLSGFARDLLRGGVPAVVAMTAPVTDPYATSLCAGLYGDLARRPEPVALAALSAVRRRLEDQRRALPVSDPAAGWAEWATPTLFQAGPALALFRREDGLEIIEARPETRPALGGMIRRVGDFVGRRGELRALLRQLRAGTRSGVLVHGIGGVGKSSLAAQLVDHLGTDAALVVPIVGAARVDSLLEKIRAQLWSHCTRNALSDTHPLRRVVAALVDATPPWRARLGLIRDVVLPQLPILLLLDNAEDNLTARPDTAGFEVLDADLAQLLADWTRLAGARLVITSRYPFVLPDRAHRRLAVHHLGPLSQAETRKLLWRLPALDALPPEQCRRAYVDLGGHPRSLEYLDALLSGGQARFADVAERLEARLEARGIRRPERWLAGVEGDLDRALAETVTLTVDDVLLKSLLERLGAVPLARRLLLGASVYQQPVDTTGLAWQVAEIVEPAADPQRDTRMRATAQLLTEARRGGVSPEEHGLTPEQREQFANDLSELRRPPLVVPVEFDAALDALLGLGLIAPVAEAAEENTAGRYLVHRWTATALSGLAGPGEFTDAHRRAAGHWRWRVAVAPQDRLTDIHQLIEARSHHARAGDLDDALTATYEVINQLHTWGAWSWEDELCRETLAWVPPRSGPAAALTHQLGVIAQLRGDYDGAEQRYQDALTIAEEIGDRAG